jgi:transposase
MVLQLTAANVNDGTMLVPLIDAMPRVRGHVGAPRKKFVSVTADKAYHSRARVLALQQRGIIAQLPQRAKRNAAQQHVDEDTHLGHARWVIERTFAWLNQFRRLRVRHERRSDIHQAFLTLGCILICFRTLDPLFC